MDDPMDVDSLAQVGAALGWGESAGHVCAVPPSKERRQDCDHHSSGDGERHRRGRECSRRDCRLQRGPRGRQAVYPHREQRAGHRQPGSVLVRKHLAILRIDNKLRAASTVTGKGWAG
jgi:hypothetical protein